MKLTRRSLFGLGAAAAAWLGAGRPTAAIAGAPTPPMRGVARLDITLGGDPSPYSLQSRFLSRELPIQRGPRLVPLYGCFGFPIDVARGADRDTVVLVADRDLLIRSTAVFRMSASGWVLAGIRGYGGGMGGGGYQRLRKGESMTVEVPEPSVV